MFVAEISIFHGTGNIYVPDNSIDAHYITAGKNSRNEHNYSQFLNSSEAEPRGGLMETEVFEFTNLVIILTNIIYFI